MGLCLYILLNTPRYNPKDKYQNTALICCSGPHSVLYHTNNKPDLVPCGLIPIGFANTPGAHLQHGRAQCLDWRHIEVLDSIVLH